MVAIHQVRGEAGPFERSGVAARVRPLGGGGPHLVCFGVERFQPHQHLFGQLANLLPVPFVSVSACHPQKLMRGGEHGDKAGGKRHCPKGQRGNAR